MRLDARIPVHVVPPGAPLPEADPQALLVVVAPELPAGDADGSTSRAPRWTPGWTPGWTAGWMAVRQVAAEDLVATAHPAGCACCTARSPLALLLSSLFEQRARGTLDLFRRVWMTGPAGLAEAVPALLASDPVVAGRYRPGEK